jgi:endonuclease YncB( thermonuclease family)
MVNFLAMLRKIAIAVSLIAAAANAVDAAEEIRGRALVQTGDTLTILAKRIGLYGIVAPAANQKCLAGALPWLCGTASRQQLTDLIKDKIVTCVEKGTDKSGRILATCTVDGTDLARSMVRAGMATADPETGKDYKNTETAARGQRVGIWQGAR